MLYNQQWEVTNLDGFIAWLRERPADSTYDWGDGEACLMAQYLQDRGVNREPAMPSWYASVTMPRPWTFAAALERAESFRRH